MNGKLNSILKTSIIKSFAVLTIIGTTDSAVFSQKRIYIPRGQAATTVSGKIAWRAARSYVLRASAGQTMTVRVSSQNASVWADVGGDNIGKGTTVELDSTDDYIITVHNDGSETNFSLYVAIR